MAEGIPESYEELIAVLDALPTLVLDKRRREGMSQRAAARDAGLDQLMIRRVEMGDGLRLDTAKSVLRWLGRQSQVRSTVEPEL